jgi:hypothetical protein
MQSALILGNKERRILRRWILFFIVALVVSGISAIPVVSGSQWLSRSFPPGTAVGDWMAWIAHGLAQANERYPFLFYGFDWLAFAHFLFAILFIGVYRDPVRNRWVIEFGMIACMLIIPFALLAGHFRGIPLWWRFLDCSFGIIGLIPLSICNSLSWKLEKMEKGENAVHSPETYWYEDKKVCS